MKGNRHPKIFYATQIGVNPPTIVLFTNGPELFDDTYVRYLTKTLRDTFPFSEVAIKVVLRAKGESAGPRRDDVIPEELLVEEGDGEAPPIVRKVAKSPEPPAPPKPRKRKPKPGAETWEF
jgi:GTPase